MRALALAWVSLVSTGLARRLHEESEGSLHRRSAVEVENPARASIGSKSVNDLASLLFAVNPSVAAGLRARSAIGRPSSIRSHPHSYSRQSRLAELPARMVLGDDREFDPLNLNQHSKEPDEFSSKAISSTIALALAFAPLAASAVPPDIYKVDKTGWIGAIANVIEGGIDLFHDSLANAGVAGAYGFSILLFTILVKFVTLPLLNVQIESTSKMQALQPLQKKVIASYSPREEQEKNQMLARLFQSANVNPLLGLLPAFAQIPIFIALYRALQNLIAEDKLEEAFLWIPSLEGPVSGSGGMDWLFSSFSGNPTWGYDGTLQFLSLSVILWVVQTLSIKLAQPPRDPDAKMTEQEEMTQSITTFLPLMVTFFSLNVPAGLSIYWIFNSIFTTLFTQIIKAKYKNAELPPEVQQIVDALDRRANAKKAASAQRAVQYTDAPPMSTNKVFQANSGSDLRSAAPVYSTEAEPVTFQAATKPKRKKRAKKNKKNSR